MIVHPGAVPSEGRIHQVFARLSIPFPFRAHYVQSLSRWRFHCHPGADTADGAGVHWFDAGEFGLDVVGFDIEVDAVGMADGLHLDVQALLRVVQARVAFAPRPPAVIGCKLLGRRSRSRPYQAAVRSSGGYWQYPWNAADASGRPSVLAGRFARRRIES